MREGERVRCAKRAFALILLAAVWLHGTSHGQARDAESRHAAGFDFAAVKTFAWGMARPIAEPNHDELQTDPRLRAAVTAALVARGLEERDTDPDLTVWLYRPLPARDGTGGALYAVLDLVDRAGRRVVWRGHVPLEALESRPGEVFATLLAGYPPATE